MNCPKCHKPMFQVYFGNIITFPVYRCLKCDIVQVTTEEPIKEE